MELFLSIAVLLKNSYNGYAINIMEGFTVHEPKNLKIIYIVSSILFIIIGVGMMIMPDMFIYTLYFVFGGICLLCGILRIVGYFSADLYKLAFQFGLSTGVLSVAAGLVFLCFPTEGILILQVVVGLVLLVSGVLKIQTTVEARRFGLQKWWILCIFAAVCILLGLLMIAHPFTSIRLFVRILGGILIIDELQRVFDVLYMVKYKR